MCQATLSLIASCLFCLPMYFVAVFEVQQYLAEKAGIETSLVQLSSGQLDLHLSDVELPGVTLVCSRSSSHSHWQEVKRSDHLHFGHVVTAEGPMLSCGQDFNGDLAQVWFADREVDLILHGPFLGLEVSVTAELVEELGWHVSGPAIRPVSRQALRRLVRTGLNLFRLPRSIDSKRHPGALLALRDKLLTELEAAMQPWLTHAADEEHLHDCVSRYFGTVQRARILFEYSDPHVRMEIDRLTRVLGVSRATLFRAFKKTLGLSPQQYFMIRRLHDARSALQRSSKDTASVTRIATGLGFYEMGRFAANYRRQFGEHPSSTLARGYGGSALHC